jgi:hypothetical protein
LDAQRGRSAADHQSPEQAVFRWRS